MKTVDYYIKEKKYSFSIDGSPEFKSGKDEVLAGNNTDIVFNQAWYNDGFLEAQFLDELEFSMLKQGLIESIEKIISEVIHIKVEGFNLENYHHFIKTDEDHFKVVSRTRDLFSEDFNFPIDSMIPRLGKILNLNLSDIDPSNNNKLHIIVRINRPNSNDFNPPHKDIYEAVDNESYIPQFVNFWIPIAGVTEKSNLPIVPGSHLLNENKLIRTFDGGKIGGNQYRVRMIKSWNGENNLIRSTVKYGQVLVFSSHLIHGLAVNEENDLTRVALEFRLFEAKING